MKRYLAIPAAAIVAYAQQPAMSEAEQAVRAQVDKYYTFVQQKKYREAEKLVAEDARDDYYNGKKPEIKGFNILSVKMADDGQTATVLVKAKMVVMAFGNVQIFDIPSETHWKMEQGEWRWYPVPAPVLQTPFGAMQGGPKLDPKTGSIIPADVPNIAQIMGGVSIDRETIELTKESPEATVIFNNKLDGEVRLVVLIPERSSFAIEDFDKAVPRKSSRTLHFRLLNMKPGNYNATIVVDPLSKTIPLTVSIH